MSKSETDGGDPISVNVPSTSKYPLLRRRRRLFIIALDCYNEKGAPEKKLVQVCFLIFFILEEKYDANSFNFILFIPYEFLILLFTILRILFTQTIMSSVVCLFVVEVMLV